MIIFYTASFPLIIAVETSLFAVIVERRNNGGLQGAPVAAFNKGLSVSTLLEQYLLRRLLNVTTANDKDGKMIMSYGQGRVKLDI